jgi:putative DNA primase/helicase
VKDASAGRVAGKVLFNAYLQWADEENLPARERWTRQTFFRALEERGLTPRRSNQGKAFEGVRRIRQTDKGADPEQVRAESGALADYTPEPPVEAPSQGASLDDVL